MRADDVADTRFRRYFEALRKIAQGYCPADKAWEIAKEALGPNVECGYLTLGKKQRCCLPIGHTGIHVAGER